MKRRLRWGGLRAAVLGLLALSVFNLNAFSATAEQKSISLELTETGSEKMFHGSNRNRTGRL